MQKLAARISLAAAALMVAVASCTPAQPGARPQASTLFAKPWNSGLDPQEPPFQTQSIDANTFVIRQSLHKTFEAPFLHLLFGDEKALLIDTGVEGGDLRQEVDRLIDAWLAANKRQSIALVVMHSHGHGDHVGGDAALAGRPDTVVVGHRAEDVAAFFAIKSWPTDAAAFDLGGRVVDVLPTPGHHPSHVMVYDQRTRLLFGGDTIYPGRLYFQCAKSHEILASIRRIAAFAARHDVRWILGGHIEMKTAPGQSFESTDRVRRDEHLLELPPSILPKITDALAKMADHPRVETFDEFILFPHPPDPRGKQPPDWCRADAG